MSLRLYMDAQVPRVVAEQLGVRGVDVLTAQEDGHDEAPDEELLTRAGNLRRVLFTQDADFLREGALRQERGEPFAGIIYLHQLALVIGPCVDDLELLAKVTEPEEFVNRVEYLPLR